MTDTKPPSAEAMEFADWVLEFLVGYKTWAIEENRLALAQRIDAFAERRAAEAHGEWAEVIEMVQSALSEATGKSAGGFAPMCWNDAIRLLAKDRDERAAEARRAAIEECADTCRSLGHYSGSNIQPAIEQIADAILALAGNPAAGKNETNKGDQQ